MDKLSSSVLLGGAKFSGWAH